MPKLSKQHPKAVCPGLTVNDLFIYRDVFEGIRANLSLAKIAVKIGVSRRKCQLVLEDVAAALLGPGASAAQLRLKQDNSVGYTFYQGLSTVLDPLTVLQADCNKGHDNRVVVQGSDFSVLWVMPSVLAECGFLRSAARLEIRRGSFQRYMANLRNGRTDLAVGPEAPPPLGVTSVPLIAVPRVLIYPEKHTFACGKLAADIRLEDLGQETVFYLESEAVPAVKMRNYFPRPFGSGKRVAVDSVSHIYQYVDRALGVSLGYDPAYVPPEYHPRVRSQPLRGEDAAKVPPAEFLLYYSDERKLSAAARQLAEAICTWAGGKSGRIVTLPTDVK